MKKTLGGDRLGAGNKMTVDMRNYERSTHNLSYVFRTTMSAGTLVPFMCQVGLPGDTFDIKLDCNVMTHPTIGPLFGSFKTELDIFMCPMRLYNAQLHNNALSIGMNMANVKFPTLTLKRQQLTSTPPLDIDNCQINPSCILAYLGIRGVGQTNSGSVGRDFNAQPLIAYWDIYKNYYSNKQEEIGYVVHTPALVINQVVTNIKISVDGGADQTLPQTTLTTPISLVGESLLKITYTGGTAPSPDTIKIKIGTVVEVLANIATLISDTGTVATYHIDGFTDETYPYALFWDYITATDSVPQPIQLTPFSLENIDDMREALLQAPKTTPYQIESLAKAPYNLVLEGASDFYSAMSSQEGLAIKTYQSDLLNNWLQTDWVDGVGGITDITSIDTSSGKFTIDTLNLAKKVYDMLNRIAVSGGTYDDWLDAQYTTERIQRAETPMYMGGLIKELVFEQIVSQAQATGTQTGTQPLGTLAGKGTMHQKHKGGDIIVKVDEPCYIIGIVSLTPRIDYSQGNSWDIHLKTMNDLHVPAMDEIGFQELSTELAAWWDSKQETDDSWTQYSAGKQPAWINYMTNINKVYGNFAIATNEMFMTLNRKYEAIWDAGTSKYLMKDLTTYIDPAKYNNIFAETSLDSQNFWTQIGVNIEARRKMSAKIMPNL